MSTVDERIVTSNTENVIIKPMYILIPCIEFSYLIIHLKQKDRLEKEVVQMSLFASMVLSFLKL